MSVASDAIGKEAAAIVARLVDAIDTANRDLTRLVRRVERSGAMTRDDFDADVVNMASDIWSALYAFSRLAESLAFIPLSQTPEALDRLKRLAEGRLFDEGPTA